MEQKLADLGLGRVDGRELVRRQRRRRQQPVLSETRVRDPQRQQRGEDMRKLVVALLAVLALPALADLREARELMKAGKFAEAREMLLVPAQSGNADAEDLMGAIHDLGLGVEADPQRAVEWYTRAALKGHPGAQAALARHYEQGSGLPAPDPVRAYVWYVMAVLGGDADAARGQEALFARLSVDEIRRAHVLIGDYRSWLHPFQ